MSMVLDPCDLDFLAEHTLVQVLPKAPGPQIQLAEGDFGPFRPGIPVEVPLWVAVNLRQRNKCQLLAPDWMTVENLRNIKEAEITTTGFTKMPSENYFEVAHILLTNGLSDIDDADEIRGLVKSIWDLRLGKLRASVLQFIASGGFHARLDDLTQIEINSVRPVFPQALTQLMRIREKDYADVGKIFNLVSTCLLNSKPAQMMSTSDWNGRWDHLNKLLLRTGPCADGDFEPSDELLAVIQENCKILVVGAGGLGCELLKNLCLMGFVDIHVIDMDTIDLSNLNRQFLFRQNDIGQPKAEVAANFINKRVPGARVTAHYKKIQDYDEDFYRQFNIVVCGLDSVVARRWMNSMLVSIALDPENSQLIPLIDGGTEGFKGNARVVLPGKSACIECTLSLYPPQVSFPMCTIAQTPRLPEHCIEYVRLMQWNEESPHGKDIDGDNPDHIQWIYEKAMERGTQYGISGITYRLTQGVIKNIIPAVASTNAIIAAACATEVFKVVSGCAPCLNNYTVFNDTDGIYAYTYEQEKKEDCMVCSKKPQHLQFREDDTLEDVIEYLMNSPNYQMRNPSVTMVTEEGKNKTLFIQTVEALKKATEQNLKKSLRDLNISNGTELAISDVTSPSSQTFIVHFDDSMKI